MSSAFLEDDPAQTRRPLPAPRLALELRETIARWFAARGTMPSSEMILLALADLLADQIGANPDPEASLSALELFNREYMGNLRAICIRRLGGTPVTIVKQ